MSAHFAHRAFLTPAALATFVSLASWSSTSTHAQEFDPSKEIGIRGHIAIAPELLAATEWPLSGERARELQTPARTRRPMGRPLRPLTEPMPALAVVLEGDLPRTDPPPAPTLVIEGMRFVPAQSLLVRPGPIKLVNKQQTEVHVVSETGNVLATVPPGGEAMADLAEGAHALTMRELPYAHADVRVLGKGRLLPFDDDGNLPRLDVPGGDYQLSYYLGAAVLRSQALNVPERMLVFIESAVSAHGDVETTVKVIPPGG